MLRMLYVPRPLFGLAALKIAPVVVEVLELDAGRGMARVRLEVPAGALINVLARVPRMPRSVVRLVIAADLKAL